MAYADANGRVATLGAMPRLSRSRTMPDDSGYWCEQMVRVSTAQDTDCFMRIYDHFAPKLQRYLLGLKVAPSQAEELVQEAMLRVWRHATVFDGARASVATWVFRIARNLYLDGVRAQRHPAEEAHDDVVLETADLALGPESYADHAGLARAIDELPPAAARLIRMSYLESKSHSEIAAELNLPLGTVKSTLRRSFEVLRSALRPTT